MKPRSRRVQGGIIARLWRYAREHRGTVGPLTALLIVPLIGVLGMAAEVSNWLLVERAMQNAADSAAVAAATNNDGATGGTTYQTEAESVAANYGFSTHVSVTYGTVASVPKCASANCYSVTITKTVPIYLLQIVGYSGNSGTTNEEQIEAGAVASPSANGSDYCVLVTGGTGVTMNMVGGSVTLNSCSLQINSNSASAFTMVGGTLTATQVSIVGGMSNVGGCLDLGGSTSCPDNPATDASTQSVPTAYTDLYSTNSVSSLTSQSCPAVNNGVTLVGGTKTISQGVYCNGLSVVGGTLTMTAGVYILQGGAFSNIGGTITGTGVTIILTCGAPPCTGSSANWATANLTGGTTDLSAPTSGSWAGMLLYQDPTETNNPGTNTNSLVGSSNSFEGVLYFPDDQVSYTGGSAQCTQLIAYDVTLVGGTINSNCANTGVTNIGTAAAAVALVQ